MYFQWAWVALYTLCTCFCITFHFITKPSYFSTTCFYPPINSWWMQSSSVLVDIKINDTCFDFLNVMQWHTEDKYFLVSAPITVQCPSVRRGPRAVTGVLSDIRKQAGMKRSVRLITHLLQFSFLWHLRPLPFSFLCVKPLLLPGFRGQPLHLSRAGGGPGSPTEACWEGPGPLWCVCRGLSVFL